MIALGRALLARGHEVSLQTWARWREHVEAEGIGFLAAPEYRVFPTGSEPLDFYEAVVQASRDTLPAVQELEPDVVVADILTLAPALAAELAGVPLATLIPHVYPDAGDGFPVYSIGARLPRRAIGRSFWRAAQRPVTKGLERGRRELNATRAELGLPELEHVHGGISRELALVATLPQLEYPRAWPPWAKVVGPLMWEPPSREVALPPGRLPAGAGGALHRPGPGAAPAQGLAGGPRRSARACIGHLQRAPATPPPASARQRDRGRVAVLLAHDAPLRCWSSATPATGRSSAPSPTGCPVLACPAVGDMAENAARLDWAGAGVRIPPRLLGARSVRVAVQRILEDRSITARAREIQTWEAGHDSGRAAAELSRRWPSSNASSRRYPAPT